MSTTLGLYKQPFRIDLDFNNYSEFEHIMKTNFNLLNVQAKFLYDAHFSYNKTFLYRDLDGLFENKDDFHNFLANSCIVDTD